MKNTFAELLTEIISQSEISKNEMIRTCDIDRSSFFKFLSGQRIPTMEQFNRICEKLQFSPSEEKSLRLEYAKITQGEQKIRSGNRIIELLWKLEDSNNIEMLWKDYDAERRETEKTSELTESVIQGKRKVLELLKSTVLNEALLDGNMVEIDMFIPQRTEEFLEWLVGFLRSDLSSRVRIRHLIELPSRSINTEQILLERLRFSLLSTAENSKAYSGYYYYAYNSISSCVGVLYAYSLITDHRVVLLNEKMDKAIAVADSDFCRDYRDYFMATLNSAKPIIKKVKEQDIDKELNKPLLYRYGGQIILENPKSEGTVLFISTGCVRRFAETGSFSEKNDLKTIGTKERVEYLNKAKKKIGSKVFLIDERSIPPAGSWIIALSGKDKLIMHRKDADCFFIVTEPSIVEAFYTFMEGLPNSGNLIKTELAHEIFDNILAGI